MSQRLKNLIWFIIIIAAFVIVTQLRGSSGIYLDFGDDVLTVSAPNDFSHTIPYDNIVKLELVELTNVGTAVSGDENRKYYWGTWENDTWGQYTLCASKKINNAILITTTNKDFLVFNYESKETTEAMLKMFTELLENQG